VVVTEDQNDDFSELRAFVAGTLKAIMDGISDAQATATLSSPFGSGVHAYNAPKEVSFDVAVSAERATSAKGGFNLKILSVGADAGAKSDKSESTVTRIQFSVRTEFKSKDADRPVNIPSMKPKVV
jgi:hypothetical protein